MSYDTLEISNVAGAEESYKIQAGSTDGDTLSQDTYWADQVDVNGNRLTTGTQVTIDGDGMTVEKHDGTPSLAEIEL